MKSAKPNFEDTCWFYLDDDETGDFFFFFRTCKTVFSTCVEQVEVSLPAAWAVGFFFYVEPQIEQIGGNGREPLVLVGPNCTKQNFQTSWLL